MHRILLLEDNDSFGYILSEYLTMQDFKIDWVKSGEKAIQSIQTNNYDLAILDIMLPGIDGYEVATKIKQINPDLPFIFLSAKSLKIDKLKGFKTGAYDYVTKPIEEEILVAKINALLQIVKTKNNTSTIHIIGEYSFYPSECKLYFKQTETKLTARESELLALLCEHKNTLLSRKKALHQIWQNTDEFSRKSMDVFISHLRKCLSKDENVKIENVHSKGFILRC